MIFDRLDNHPFYNLGNLWHQAFGFLNEATPNLADGKYTLRGDDLFAIVMSYSTKGPDAAELEAHRRYLDIQVLLTGREGVDCHFVPNLEILKAYDPSSDAALYRIPDTPPARFVLTPGHFLALFPHDAHRPCLQLCTQPEPVRKVVIKAAVQLLDRAI